MHRRSFLTLLGAAAAWPLAARAQQDGRVRRVGVLMPYPETDPEGQTRLQVFRQGLADLGWIEGRNIRLDVRWPGADIGLQRLGASELATLASDAILVNGTTATQALREVTRTIPIVFAGLSDPVATGVVANLARPESNVTGYMAYEHSLAGKWLSLLKDISPQIGRVALLFNPTSAPWAPYYVLTAQSAGERLGLKITEARIRGADAIEPTVAAIAGSGDGGLMVLPDVFLVANRASILAYAAQHRVPAIYTTRSWPLAGGLMSYGADQRLQFRDGAAYVDRILRGAKVAELPVQFATKFELVINLKTAKALGLDVAQQLQFLADEVIE